jgi:hypothetical protein
MWIMVCGPYSTGAADEAARARNLDALNAAALEVFARGHVPIVGVNMALPLVELDGAPDAAERLTMPISLALADRCDAALRVGGPSGGADQEIARFAEREAPVYTAVEQIPRA